VSTKRGQAQALEGLINDTLREAVDLAFRCDRRGSLATTGGRRSA
jgi:hypothetical protein